MIQSFLLLLISIFGLSHGIPLQHVVVDLPQFECIQYQSHCTLRDIELSPNQPNFEIIANEPEKIRSVEITNSKIPVLASDLCATFPALETLELVGVGINVVNEDALTECKNLISLALNDNEIEHLPEHIFDNAVRLRYLYLEDNSIREIGDNQFVQNTELMFLYLSNNNIDVFPASAVWGLSKLFGLSLDTNDLMDLEDGGFIENLPKLNYIAFNHNELACERVGDILENFKKAKIAVFADGKPKERYYRPWKIEEISCLMDKDWTGVYYRKANHELGQTLVDDLGIKVHQLEHVVSDMKAKIH